MTDVNTKYIHLVCFKGINYLKEKNKYLNRNNETCDEYIRG